MSTRRAHTRLRLPVRALLGGQSFPLIDLSLGGCALRLVGGKVSGLLPVTLVFPPHNGEAEQFPLWTQVLHHTADGRLTLRFLDVDEDLLLALRALLDRLAT